MITEWKGVLKKLGEQLKKAMKASTDHKSTDCAKLSEEDINKWTEEPNSLKEELGDFKHKQKKKVSFSKVTEIGVFDGASDSQKKKCD